MPILPPRTNVTKHWLMNILRIIEFDAKYLLILVSQNVVQIAYDIHIVKCFRPRL